MVNIKKVECPKDKYSIKCPYEMDAEGVVIHNTLNDATAMEEIQYMHRNNNKTSFHYAVDENEIVQGIDLNRNAWNAGDGSKGEGNRKYIAIEICRSYCKKQVDGKWVADEETWKRDYKAKFEQAQRNAAELTAKILKERGWGIERVKKHQDFSGKYCPHRTLADYGWEYFLNLVEGYMTPAQPAATTSTIKKGDLVSIKSGAKYYNGKSVPNWVMKTKWYVKSDVVGDRAVINKSEDGKYSINSPINVANLTVATQKNNYFKKYTEKSASLVDALKAIGAENSFSYRKKIAKANGVTLYVGTASQNTKLLGLLKQGKLIKP